MGKSKGGTSSSSGGGGKKKGSSSAKQAADVCQCEDPYKCTCGKRPERPSKGHKWDIETKQWAGKGHKQKGASAGYAFTSTKDTVVKTTEKGGTKLAAWQSLPSTILREQCSKEKRPPPKFTLLKNDKQATSSNTIKYRCIVKDYKKSAKSENDLIFIPLNGCLNDEQAMEESALLALVQLTPKLPHERRLPEPYKTTWLHAIGEGTSSKIAAAASETSNANKEAGTSVTAEETAQQTSSATTATGTTSMATINTSLTQGVTFASRKEKEDFYQKKKASANTRKRRMEAQQQANANHSCFMSASIRHKIEWLLRGGTGAFHDDDDDENDDENDKSNMDQLTEIQRYVYERLLSEGFTSKQSLRSIKENNASNDEEEESYYETCLQWLCIHLNEHQLPEGFDPRGRTLDVVTTTTTSKTSDGSASTNAPMSRTVKVLTNKYGLSMEEAQYIESKCFEGAKKGTNETVSPQEQQPAAQPDGFTVACTLWNEICHKTDISSSKVAMIQPPKKGSTRNNNDVLEEELEALKAIFFEEGSCMIDDNAKLGVLKISLSLSSPMNEAAKEGGERTVLDAITSMNKPPTQLCVYVSKQCYPHQSTLMAFLANVEETGTSSNISVAATMLYEIATFVSTLTLGEPMVYELYTHVLSLLNQPLKDFQANNNTFSLIDGGESSKNTTNKNKQNDKEKEGNTAAAPLIHQSNKSKPSLNRSNGRSPVLRRPTDQPKSTFWTTLPKDTKPAVSNPQISSDIQRQRRKLPAQSSKQEFLSLLKNNRVVLVTGETGCGKTTQIPQFILEEDPTGSKIVVAQPRRLAATGVAGRVATERGEDNVGSSGTSVGYVVRGDVKSCASSTRLLFCTTGVLLRQLQSEHALDCISHIVVDEVHERHLDTDLLLGLLKQMLSSDDNFKIILMSATMDADKLANYWSNVSDVSSSSTSSSVPRMHIPGLTYPVEDYTLEDALRLTGYIPPKNGKKKKKSHNKKGSNHRKQTPWNDSQHSDNDNDDNDEDGDSNNPAATSSSSNAIDKLTERRAIIDKHMSDMINRIAEHEIQYELLALLIQHLLDEKSKSKDDGSILVFLPGAPEIAIAETTIQQMLVKSGRHSNIYTLLPLHGGLQPSQQNLVFRSSIKTKIILSTNVAETSITIPDCTLVVDTCREKQSSFDPINRMPLLLEKFASKDSLKQRRGRAGRVRSGKCYKLISQITLQKLPDHGTPEIQRCALDQTLLQVMFLGFERSRKGTFLQTLLDPPSSHAIESSVRALETLGAIQSKGSEQIELTPMGMHLAGIPAPPTVAKLLIMGSILGCRDAALAIAAGLTLGRSPFLKIMPPRTSTDNRRHNDNDDDDEKDIQKEKEDFKNVNILKERTTLFKLVGNSDHAMLAAVYQKWYHMDNFQEQKRYCETLGLNQNGMKDMKLLVQQYNSALISLGFTDDDRIQKKKQTKNVSWRTVRACVVAALAPHQLVRVQRPSAKYAETSEGAVAKDVEAKQVRFFVRASDVEVDTSTNNEVGVTTPAKGYQTKRYYDILEEQVYVHPSSQCFSVGSYSCPWLVYHELVRTSKPFLRDATEASAYALLLFGGSIQVQASKGTIVVDNYIRLSASPRIGALVGGLRQHVDALLEAKVASPTTIDIASSDVMTTVVQLIVSDGLGKF